MTSTSAGSSSSPARNWTRSGSISSAASLDAAGLIRLRLSEHAIHVWDVAVRHDPGASVADDAILPAMEQITQLFQFVAKPAGDAFRVRVRTTAPER